MSEQKEKRVSCFHRLKQWIHNQLTQEIQEVPEEIANCEFDCRKLECREGEMETCKIRLQQTTEETTEASIDSVVNLAVQSNLPLVLTIIVNWKGADDTIECLESLFASDYPNQRVIVVDNGSKDGSLSKLAAWAEGTFPVCPKSDTRGAWVPVVCERLIPVVTLSLDDAVNRRGWEAEANLVLVDAGRNRGFAGGVNIGLQFALANNTVRYVWVLNNDTVVAGDCLSRMVRRMGDDSALGMCGSRILYYSQPDRVQVLGGARFVRGWARAI